MKIIVKCIKCKEKTDITSIIDFSEVSKTVSSGIVWECSCGEVNRVVYPVQNGAK